MKIISANAGELARALALAASCSEGKARKIAALEAVRLQAADGAVTVTANVLDHQLTIGVAALVEAPGELVVSGTRLAALVAGFPATAEIEISTDGTVARVGCGRSRYRLPTVPLLTPTPALKLAEELGCVSLAREEVAELLVWPAFAAAHDPARFYLNGALLHDDAGALVAVATDGHRLVRVRIPGAAGLSADFALIVPNAALKIIGRLLGDKGIERVTLRRSRTLFSFEGAKVTFISKLIDGTFPTYVRLIPKVSKNTVTVDRAELIQALARASAVADAKQRNVAGLTWDAGEAGLRVCLADGGDAADDVVNAEATGTARVAVQIELLVEILDAFDGARVKFDSAAPLQPMSLTDPDDDENLLALLMPCRWVQAVQAA